MWNGLKKLSKKYDGFLKKLLQKFVASQGENIKKCCKYYYAAQYDMKTSCIYYKGCIL